MSKLADELISCRAIRHGRFTLSSGGESNYYVHIKRAMTDPKLLHLIAKEIADRIYDDEDRGDLYECLAGMELGGIPLVTAVALETDLPFLMIRKKRKGYGMGVRIEGNFTHGDHAILIEDVTTTGASSLDAISALAAGKIKVKKVISVVDREEGAADALQKLGIPLVSLVKTSQLMESPIAC